MPYKHYHARSSSSCSTSSHDEVPAYTSDRFFAPAYAPADINAWRAGAKRDAAMYYAQHTPDEGSPSQTSYFMGSALYASPVPHDAAPPPLHLAGQAFAPMYAEPTHEAAPPAKRSRKDKAGAAAGRMQGACTRCKRLKMKCTFADTDNTCARCIVGGHDCVVLGRKPRSPGMREILRKQIREKDAQIDSLLAKLNPASASSTPLSINTARLPLTPAQRATYRDVLLYLDKAQNTARPSAAADGARPKIDVSALDADFEYDSDEDDDGSGGSGLEELQESAAGLHLYPRPATIAPAGVLASTASRLSSPDLAREPHAGGSGASGSSAEGGVPAVGITSAAYFEPGPFANLDLRRLIVERQAAPDIILSGLITNDDVGPLFDIYWKWIHPIIPILDENIHTPAAVLGRCPFLFTVICAISSKFYTAKPHVYTMAVHLARAAAAGAFLDGCKTVELCQAYALMAAYMPPARRWDEDRTFVYSGMAFRLAVDLELHRVPAQRPADERAQREVLNRLRTYVTCYIIDRSFCINLGKPFMMPEEELVRNAAALFLGWPHSLPVDNYLVSLVELYRLMTRFMEFAKVDNAPAAGPRSEKDVVGAHRVFSEELAVWHEAASKRCAAELAPDADRDDCVRMALMTSVYQYCRLIIFYAGLRAVLQRGELKDDTVFFAGCLQAASAVINCVVERILPTGFIRYSPEHVFALSAFGTAMLAKCLRPEFAGKLDARQEARIVALIKRLLQAIDAGDADADHAAAAADGSAESGADREQSTPRKRYGRFLQQLVASRVLERKKRRAAAAAAHGGSAEGHEHEHAREEVSPVTPPHPQMHAQHEHAHTYAHSHAKAPQDVAMPDADLAAFAHAWDPHALHPEQALFAFEEAELMPAFMAFPEHDAGSGQWFMQSM